jgi:hypothetical protein
MFKFLHQGDYHHVPEGEESKTLISESSSIDSEPYTRRARHNISPLLVGIPFFITSILTCMLGLAIGRRYPSNLDAKCTKHVSKYCKSCSMTHPYFRNCADHESGHSTDHRRGRYILQSCTIQRLLLQRGHLPSGCWAGSRRGMGGFGRELYVTSQPTTTSPATILSH